MSWQIERKLAEYLADETGYYKYPFGTRRAMALCYPNTYEVAMSNLGMQIIYREVNERADWLCERAFLPDKELAALYAKERSPLLTLETAGLSAILKSSVCPSALKWIILIFRPYWNRAACLCWLRIGRKGILSSSWAVL